MAKVIIITGAEQQARIEKLKEITAGKSVVIQALGKPFKFTEFEDVPVFYAFAEATSIKEPVFISLLKVLAFSEEVYNGNISKPAPIMILTTPCSMADMPDEFINDGYEIINLNKPN